MFMVVHVILSNNFPSQNMSPQSSSKQRIKRPSSRCLLKMPQRTSIAPTSLRRSPRLQQSNCSPKTPNLVPKNPKNLSSNSRKSSKNLKNSANGLINLGKSANGSKRTTTFCCKVEKFEGLRRSPRFCNEVISSINHHLSFIGNAHCDNRKNKELISLGNDGMIMVDCPVTPIRVREKKNNDSGDDNSDSSGEIWLNSERRITRSCSKLAKSKVEVGRSLENKRKGRNFSKPKACESNSRKVGNVVQPSAVRLSCDKVKEKRIDSCKGVRRGTKAMSLDSLSRCVTRGGKKGRQSTRKDDHYKEAEAGDSSREVVGNSDKRITCSASKKIAGDTDSMCRTMERRSTRVVSKQVMSKAGRATRAIAVKEKGTHDCVELDIDKFDNGSSDALSLDPKQGGEKNKLDLAVDRKLTGVKRKRKQVGVLGKDQGWTKEQELALHKAYFTAKPSPDFWKKVAKLVPGKSAQDCFDKVHSDNQTPLCTKPSSRVRKQKSPISDFELFDTAKTKSKKTRKTNCKSHLGRKTVRQLLQKYCHLNQDSEADLFTILEPSVNPTVEPLNLTPKHLMQSPESSSKSRDRSSSGHKKCLSRLHNQNESPLTSPPVLKKVKNMGLHEKYIDQLHTREHKRKVAFSRCMKSAQNQTGGSENCVHLKDVIKAAKEALVSDAKEVIDKYRYSQANIMEALSDSEEYFNSDNDEDETML